IKGRVYDRETGAPVANVTVSLAVDVAAPREGPPRQPPPNTITRPDPPRQAKTDAQGRYVFDRLPAGSYFLSSSPPEYKVTYLPQAYGATRPTDPTRPPARRPVPLAEGQTLENIDLPLWRSLAITGHVTDEFGDPLANLPITANLAGSSQRVGSRGPYQIVTDDRGAFRMFGLPPGRYVICAAPQGFVSRGGDEPTERYVKTCAPSAATEAEAQVVELANGDFGDVEIRMGRGRAYKITGTAMDSQGKPVPQVSIVRSEDNNGFSSTGSQSQPTGGFTFPGLVAGNYTVVARVGNIGMATADTAEMEVGSVPVHLDGADVENLVVTTSKGITVSGHVLFEGAAPPPAKGLRVMLRPAPGAATMIFGPAPSSEVTAELTFTLKGIFGAYGLNVSGLPAGWIVKSVRLGGDDVTDRVVDFRGKDRLEVVLSNRPATLSGRVVLGQGETATDYRVLLFSVDQERWKMFTGGPTAGLRPDGTFKLTTVRPGEYFVALIRQEDMAPSMNAAATLEKLAKVAQRVTLLDDETREIDLTIPR
ncbi:MAG: carboxypeptidase-like regulatory domain-containing protein, partial [Vicinamibacterales bacterium]